MDFMLWPRNDIEKIVCLLFSRWKGADHEPFRPVQVAISYMLYYFVHHNVLKCSTIKVNMYLICIQRLSLNFTMGTMRSSFCMLLGVRTRLGWWWTTQISLCFFSWTDSTCRLVVFGHCYRLGIFKYTLIIFTVHALSADSKNQGHSFQVVQPLPVPATGSADLLGGRRHRRPPPPVHARLVEAKKIPAPRPLKQVDLIPLSVE